MVDAVLVLNAGSSSLKFAVFRSGADGPQIILRGQCAGIGTAPTFSATRFGGATGKTVSEDIPSIGNHQQAIAYTLDWIQRNTDGLSLIGVGHRVVHGGPDRMYPEWVTTDLLGELDALSPLAPHHQPHNLAAIRAISASAPELPQIACFDTAFHTTQPAIARLLPLPAELRDKGLQRYGFHGISYEYITATVPDFNNGRLPDRMVVAHLGNGASLCAIRDGRSIASSMGFSTLDGLLMGTRCGGIDPGVLLHLMREEGMDEKLLTDLLYNRSGLLGVSGISADMQVLLDSDAVDAKQAIALFCYTLTRAIGSMAVALGGLDALVFTGGIGEHASAIRERACAPLAWLGIEFNPLANASGESLLTTPDSPAKAWVIPTSEELVIARHTLKEITANPRRCRGNPR